MSEKKKGEENVLGLKLSPRLLELLAKLQEIELEDFEMEVGDLEVWLQPGAVAAPAAAAPAVVPPRGPPAKAKPSQIVEVDFVPPIETYPGRIVEVKLGATKGEGGTRGKSIIIGGETAPAFYTFERPTPHPPVITLDVFDMEVPLAKAVKMHVKDVVGDPAAWAKLAVEKFGADLITIHLVSTDPLVKDASPKEAVKTVEAVAQAVDVPLIIGGCGDPVKDADVFQEVAETFAGERLLISSITGDMDVERCAKFIKKGGHVALAFTPMDLNMARELNRKLYDFLPKESIVMDLTTAALGYGLDYAFTNMERARLAALMGDPELAHPMSSGTTNAWAAREAWMKMAPEWEPRELRGPLWEVVTALTLLLAGVDLFMMMHPASVKTVKDVIGQLTGGGSGNAERLVEWVSLKP
ncbi:MAG: CO dehydrogenase/acetyl-CoA synthase subunit delta [Nitrososphaerota archaeon]|nr:CO dehydrogenase/acetyl-CoA synthase subunit delta [Candidatus Bathyarchaeota archaeon]MDW8023496.1 CO dehydrogenase/acetyl-CoA synthase subunit delta [Nitrososphaerota archaeon]